MTKNCVADTTLLSVLRYGNTDFENDGTFDGATETYYADVGARIEGLQLDYHKVVVDPMDSLKSVLVEMTAGEKTDVDDNTANVAVGTAVYSSRRTLESIGADVDIEFRPYVSQITAYSSAITLSDGSQEGQIKKIYNDGTGDAIFINGTYHGGDTQMRVNNNQNCTLIWNGSLWRHIDGIVGITFSTP